MSDAFAQRQSGLYAPAATLDKRQHVLTAQQWRKFRMCILFAREHGMRALFVCPDCHQQIQLTRAGVVGRDPASETPEMRHAKIGLSCGCTQWVIR